MKIDSKLAFKMWDDIFGPDKEIAVDCYGSYIKRSDYGDHETRRQAPDGKYYNYGWDLDHIRPISNFENENEADFLNNLEPVHWLNNQEKADKLSHIIIDGIEYHVVDCDICGENDEKGYGIKNQDGQRVDWKGISGRYYRTK